MIYGIIDQNACVNILSDVLLSYSYYNMPLKWKFQQNNDPKRRSKSVKNRFTQNRIDAMPWAAQSSDLSPIENLWGDIKQCRVGVRLCWLTKAIQPSIRP